MDTCEICSRSKKNRKPTKTRLNPVTVGHLWEQVAVDFLGPLPKTTKGNLYLLVFMDYFTHWAIAIPTMAADGIQ